AYRNGHWSRRHLLRGRTPPRAWNRGCRHRHPAPLWGKRALRDVPGRDRRRHAQSRHRSRRTSSRADQRSFGFHPAFLPGPGAVGFDGGDQATAFGQPRAGRRWTPADRVARRPAATAGV
ncbi:MAG: Ferredoxin, partial [uncultured Thermomicrobiales bacterium]